MSARVALGWVSAEEAFGGQTEETEEEGSEEAVEAEVEAAVEVVEEEQA